MKNILLFRMFVIGALILLVGASVVQSINCYNEIDKNHFESDIWWDDAWHFRKQLGIGDASLDYQMMIQVWKEDGYDDINNGVIDCENHCNDDFSDIRFIDKDQTTKLPYWIERYGIDGPYHLAYIWIKTSGSDAIFMYYGNVDAIEQSSGEDTFIRYDDFDDYEIDEIPKASRGWSTSYENGANWWKATINPDGAGLVMQGHSSSSDWDAQFIHQENFAEKGEYAVHYKLYKDNGNTWLSTVYSHSYEDDLTITRFHWDNSPWRIDWSNGDNWLPFNPNLSPKNGWANEEERLIFPEASLVHDGVEGIGGCTNEPIVGINSWKIYPFRKETHDMFLDDFLIRKFISPEPMWSIYGFEEGTVIEIIETTGGLLKTNVVIKNTGQRDSSNIDWTIELNGGLILFGIRSTGSIENLLAGDEITVSSGIILGFGQTIITVSTEEMDSFDEKEYDALIFLFLILMK